MRMFYKVKSDFVSMFRPHYARINCITKCVIACYKKSVLKSLFLLGFQGIVKLFGIHLVADYPCRRFTFRCDLARVINFICICIVLYVMTCVGLYISLFVLEHGLKKLLLRLAYRQTTICIFIIPLVVFLPLYSGCAPSISSILDRK